MIIIIIIIILIIIIITMIIIVIITIITVPVRRLAHPAKRRATWNSLRTLSSLAPFIEVGGQERYVY